MKSIGCKVDGNFAQQHAYLLEGGRRNSIVLSILKDEWFDEVKENLEKKLFDLACGNLLNLLSGKQQFKISAF